MEIGPPWISRRRGYFRLGSKPGGDGKISFDDLKELTGGASVEDPSDQGITTVKEYDYVPAQKLPDVKGVSNYKPMENDTVRFSINVWAGWAPIV